MRPIISRTRFHLLRLLQQMWVRTALCSLAAICCVLLGGLVEHFLPADWHLAKDIGADALENLLGIIAASMLTVATFSLSALVSAYAAIDSTATPRASNLLIQHSSAQNALALFIGAFVYSVMGLIALSSGIYGTGGRIVLMLGTIAMIIVILTALLRWIGQLARMGRPIHTINLVEQAAARTITRWTNEPLLGGRPLSSPWVVAESIHSENIGYVQYVDTAALQALAEAQDVDIYVLELAGTFATPERPLAQTSRPLDEDGRRQLRNAFVIGDMRTFEQDPRFSLIVLNEIAMRAMSSAINDPGTAIDIVGTVVRLLAQWAQGMQAYEAAPPQPRYPRIYVPRLEEQDLFENIFPALSRDCAGTLEVGIRLQKGLTTLAELGYPPYREQGRLHAREALERAEQALHLEADRQRLHAASPFAQEAGPTILPLA